MCFISIDGPDGSGKTLAHKTIENYFKEKGFKVYNTREPGNQDDLVCSAIRPILCESKFKPISPLTEHYLFMADRAQNMFLHVLPKLKDGYIVIQDRGRDSTTAYQTFGNRMDAALIENNQRNATDSVDADITIYLDLTPNIGLLRTLNDEKRNSSDFDETKFEDRGMSYHERVYAGYKQIAIENPERVKVIDASQSPEDVAADIARTLDEYYLKHGSFKCAYSERD